MKKIIILIALGLHGIYIIPVDVNSIGGSYTDSEFDKVVITLFDEGHWSPTN